MECGKTVGGKVRRTLAANTHFCYDDKTRELLCYTLEKCN